MFDFDDLPVELNTGLTEVSDTVTIDILNRALPMRYGPMLVWHQAGVVKINPDIENWDFFFEHVHEIFDLLLSLNIQFYPPRYCQFELNFYIDEEKYNADEFIKYLRFLRHSQCIDNSNMHIKLYIKSSDITMTKKSPWLEKQRAFWTDVHEKINNEEELRVTLAYCKYYNLPLHQLFDALTDTDYPHRFDSLLNPVKSIYGIKQGITGLEQFLS